MDRWQPNLSAKEWKLSDPAAGSCFDLGAHSIDQALVLFGRPETIQALVTRQRPQLNDEDTADDSFTIILTYEKLRKVVTLKCSMLSCLSTQPRYRLRGAKGSFVKYGIDPQEDQRVKVSPPVSVTSSSFGVEAEGIHGNLTTVDPVPGAEKNTTTGLWEKVVVSEKGNYLGFYENLKDAIQGREQIMVKPEEALDVIKIIELAKKSSKEGRRLTWEA